MISQYQGKRLSGIYTMLPSRSVTFEEEAANYNAPLERTLRLKKVMGFGAHRIVKDTTCASDLAVAAFERLFEQNLLHRDEIDALIFVSQTPDHLIPPTSNLIQGRLGLPNHTFCIDINQGCAGFVVGAMAGFGLLEQKHVHKVALVTADTLSRRCSPQDRNIYPMVGDAAAITILEKSEAQDHITACVRMDGTRSGALQIPAGGMRMPYSESTRELLDIGDGNLRAKEHFFMEGSEVFNFVLTEVPGLVEELLHLSGRAADEIDHYLFHQPNRFILQKLGAQLKVSPDKLPSNIVENFGNASSATIPTNITFNLGSAVETESRLVCIAGFGVGLSWGGMIMKLGPLDFCELGEVDL